MTLVFQFMYYNITVLYAYTIPWSGTVCFLGIDLGTKITVMQICISSILWVWQIVFPEKWLMVLVNGLAH